MSQEDIQSIASRFQEDLFVTMEKEDWEEANENFSNALVLKLASSDEVNLKGLASTLRRIWNLQEEVSFVDIAYGLVIARFEIREDLERVFDDGPWQLDKSVILMSRCEADSAPSEYTFNRLGIWAKFHNSPIGALNEKVVRKMASKIGEFCRLDRSEEKDYKCKFVRCKVWTDPTRPLVTGFYLERTEKKPLWIMVRYERQPPFCHDCGACIHTEEACKGKIQSKARYYEEWLKQEETLKCHTTENSGANSQSPAQDRDSGEMVEDARQCNSTQRQMRNEQPTELLENQKSPNSSKKDSQEMGSGGNEKPLLGALGKQPIEYCDLEQKEHINHEHEGMDFDLEHGAVSGLSTKPNDQHYQLVENVSRGKVKYTFWLRKMIGRRSTKFYL